MQFSAGNLWDSAPLVMHLANWIILQRDERIFVCLPERIFDRFWGFFFVCVKKYIDCCSLCVSGMIAPIRVGVTCPFLAIPPARPGSEEGINRSYSVTLPSRSHWELPLFTHLHLKTCQFYSDVYLGCEILSLTYFWCLWSIICFTSLKSTKALVQPIGT